MLDLAINNNEYSQTTDELAKIAEHCNVMKNNSREAQDASQNLFLACYLSTLPAATVADAFVVNVGSRSIDVFIPEFGIERTLFISDLDEQIRGLVRKENGISVSWNSSDQLIEMFTRVRVALSVDIKTSPPIIKAILHQNGSSSEEGL